MTKHRGFYCEHFIEKYKICKNKATYTYSPTQGRMQFLCGIHAKHLLGSKYLHNILVKTQNSNRTDVG